MPPQIDPVDIHSVLHGLDALRPAVGKARLNKLLRGAGTAAPPPSPLAGLFRGASTAAVDRFLEALIAEKLMLQGDEDAYFVCTITEKGRTTWQGRLPVTAPLPRNPSQWHAIDVGSDEVLTELKRWRTATASSEALPPYCVFSDKTLMEIARARPQSPADLLEISGVGPRKIEKYGSAVLKITGE